MKIINGNIELGTEQCVMCLDDHPGFRAGRKTCPKCKGTRRGPRGGRNKCGCYDGTVPNFVNLVQCGACNGTNKVKETIHSYITPEQWRSFEFKVIREENGRFGFNESYLGLGYVFTCGDYGRAWGMNDAAALIAEVKDVKYGAHQASKIAREDLTVCDHIAILVTKNGYKVKAVFGDENPNNNAEANRQVSQMFDPKGLAMAELLVKAEQ